ncbi:MAG: hypothetical protein ACPG19_12785 [Saprospiraceae bacterium]
MKRTITTFLLAMITIASYAQYPATNIYVMDMTRVGQDYFKFTDPIFLNSDNVGGYNNQPSFIDDDQLMVTSQRDGKQTDIYVYNFQNLKVTQVTNTPEVSEFSPTMIPNENAFSTVNIEKDGKTQRMWRYEFDVEKEGSVLTKDVENIGYYEWLENGKAALYIIANPSNLEIINVNTQKTVRYATNIGRCVKRMSNGDLCYVEKSESGWILKRLDIRNLDIVTIAPTLIDCEDFAILPDDTILMGKGDKIYKLRADDEKQWSIIGDFKNFNVKKITRIAVRKGKIAFVGS